MSISVCCLGAETLPRDLMTTTKYNNLSPLHIYMPRNGSAIELIATFRFRFSFSFLFWELDDEHRMEAYNDG